MSEQWWALRNEIVKGQDEVQKGINWLWAQYRFQIDVIKGRKTWHDYKVDS